MKKKTISMLACTLALLICTIAMPASVMLALAAFPTRFHLAHIKTCTKNISEKLLGYNYCLLCLLLLLCVCYYCAVPQLLRFNGLMLVAAHSPHLILAHAFTLFTQCLIKIIAALCLACTQNALHCHKYHIQRFAHHSFKLILLLLLLLPPPFFAVWCLLVLSFNLSQRLYFNLTSHTIPYRKSHSNGMQQHIFTFQSE